MATLDHHPTSKHYLIRFRFAGRSYKRSLKTTNQKLAETAVARVEETISRGVLETHPKPTQ
ncbi:MAG: hypothetical protein U0930_04705 [Pirellulales bacterium]